jgi:hypothetical protein
MEIRKLIPNRYFQVPNKVSYSNERITIVARDIIPDPITMQGTMAFMFD